MYSEVDGEIAPPNAPGSTLVFSSDCEKHVPARVFGTAASPDRTVCREILHSRCVLLRRGSRDRDRPIEDRDGGIDLHDARLADRELAICRSDGRFGKVALDCAWTRTAVHLVQTAGLLVKPAVTKTSEASSIAHDAVRSQTGAAHSRAAGVVDVSAARRRLDTAWLFAGDVVQIDAPTSRMPAVEACIDVADQVIDVNRRRVLAVRHHRARAALAPGGREATGRVVISHPTLDAQVPPGAGERSSVVTAAHGAVGSGPSPRRRRSSASSRSGSDAPRSCSRPTCSRYTSPSSRSARTSARSARVRRRAAPSSLRSDPSGSRSARTSSRARESLVLLRPDLLATRTTIASAAVLLSSRRLGGSPSSVRRPRSDTRVPPARAIGRRERNRKTLLSPRRFSVPDIGILACVNLSLQVFVSTRRQRAPSQASWSGHCCR